MSTAQAEQQTPVNPHFDHGRVVWDDAYSGAYRPVAYEDQFDEQWRLFLERRVGFHNHTGVETSDEWVDERIEELTGVPGWIERRRKGPLYPALRALRRITGDRRRKAIGGRLYLEPKFDPAFFRGKSCIDIGCGAGRWTRALLEMGATVKSCDVSENALKSTARFNSDVERLDLFTILPERADLHARFDFALCWGVCMCTHDPRLAFENAAAVVRPGGTLYTMIYAPTYHASEDVLKWRETYHRRLGTAEERMNFVYEVADRPENAINLLDMLNTFYNWTVPEEVIHSWYRANGFENVRTLNANEPNKCAFHVVGTRAA